MMTVIYRKLEVKPGAQAIAIVAHPDDEVIWMGGALQRFSDANWIVLSLCRASDKDREPKFQRVSALLGFKGVIRDLDDEGRLDDKAAVKEAKKIIVKEIQGKEFDYIFTHGENGEYGHDSHKQAHQAVQELIKEKKIKAEKILFFDYKKVDRKILPMIPTDLPDQILELTPEEYEEKRRIVAEMYGYPYDGIDVNLCTNIEAFKEF